MTGRRQSLGLNLSHQLPTGPAGGSSENMEDLSQCAGKEGFLEAEELVSGRRGRVCLRKSYMPRPSASLWVLWPGLAQRLRARHVVRGCACVSV